ncbi:MBL fold metallo-hydrolase [soil metagenome]
MARWPKRKAGAASPRLPAFGGIDSVAPMSDRREELRTPHPPASAEFGHVVPGGPAHRYPPSGPVDVRKFTVGRYDNNVYVLASGGQALIVDGAAEPARIVSEAEGLDIVGIVQTHGHHDHVGALHALVEMLDVPVLAHPGDPMPVAAEVLRDGQRLVVGSAVIEVLHTPGHTPGSVCFYVEGFLVSGDTLFPGGPGNTRGDRTDFDRIMESLDRLFRLPDETRVLPGHGLDTTLARERPYLEVWRARGW